MSTDVKKTIRMTRAQWNTWHAALLSGEYTQDSSRLYTGQGYCCLGVLQKALSGAVEEGGLPTYDWLDANRISFLNNSGSKESAPFVLANDTAYLRYCKVSYLNDIGWSFQAIAEAMEPHVQFTDEI